MALAANNLSAMNIGEIRFVQSFPVLTNVHIYAGAIVMAESGAGYAKPAAASATGRVLGIALEQVNNVGGASGAKWVLVGWGCAVDLPSTAGAQTQLGFGAYADADNNVEVTGKTANSVYCGNFIEYYSATKMRVIIAQSAT